jgi:hypothetical protein
MKSWIKEQKQLKSPMFTYTNFAELRKGVGQSYELKWLPQIFSVLTSAVDLKKVSPQGDFE